MTTQAAEPQQPKASPADNVAEWLGKRAKSKAEATPAAEETSAEAPAVDSTPPEAPAPAPAHVISPDDLLPADFEHGFFKSKPFKELYKSFRATESEMQRSQREAKESRETIERLRAEVAAKDVAVQMAVEQRQAAAQLAEDPYAEVESLWFENPRAAAAKLRDMTLAEVRQTVTAESQKNRQETEAETQKSQLIQQGQRAYQEAGVALSLDEGTWNQRAKAVLVELTDPNGKYYAQGGPMVRDNYVSAYREIFGESVAPYVAMHPLNIVAATEASNPPGSKKASIGAQPAPNAGLPTLDSEKRAAYTRLARNVGIDPDKFIQRMQQKGAN